MVLCLPQKIMNGNLKQILLESAKKSYKIKNETYAHILSFEKLVHIKIGIFNLNREAFSWHFLQVKKL